MRLIKSFKIFENIQQARSVLRTIKVSEKDKDYQTILKWFAGKEGYIGWFTKMRYEKKIPISSLKSIYDLIISNQNLIRSLPKQLTTYDEFESLQDDIEKTKSLTDVKKCYNEFPSLQKSFLDIKDDKTFNLLKSLYSLKNFQDYFNKVSRYKSKGILIDSIKSFIEGNSKSSDFNDIIKSINPYLSGRNPDADMIHKDNKNDLIIIRCFDPIVVSRLGHGTSWCIRDSSTFRSYVPDKDTYQYMIWLTDMPVWSNYSLIGLTINQGGFHTCHLKDDSYLEFSRIYELLKDRNFDMKNLYSSKLELNYNYKISELKFLFNLSDEEIFKKKKNFVPGELLSFRKIDLEKWGVTTQYQNTVGTLLSNGYTKEDIIKNKKKFYSYDISYLDEEDIRKIGFDHFDIHNLYKKIPLEELIKDKTEVRDSREFKLITPEKVVEYNLYLHNVDMQSMIKTNNYYRSPFEYLIPIDYIVSHKNKWTISDFQYLKDIDQKVIENILLNKEIKGGLTEGYEALEFINKDYIIKHKLWEKLSIAITYLSSKGFVIDDIEKYKMSNISWGTYTHGKEYPKKRMENISVFGGKHKSYEWIKVNDFIDELGLEFSSFGSSSSSKYGSQNNYELLFNLIKFYNYDLYTSIAFYKKLKISSSNKNFLFEVIDNLISKGLNLKEYDNVYELIKEMSSTSSSVENYIKVILHYKLEKLYKESFELAKKNSISYDTFKDLEGKGYDSDLNKIKNHLEITYLRKKINPLYSSMGAREASEKDMKEIYEYFVEKIPGLKWVKTNEYSHWDADKELIGLFYLLVHLNKLDEFKKENYEFDNKTLTSVYRVICGTSRANGRKNCGIPLTKEDNERAFKWLKENYIKNALTDWENSAGIEMSLPPLFKYDKELFDKVFNKLITLNRKYSYYHNDKKVYKTNCIDNFKIFFNYLLSEKDPLEPKEEEFYISECEKYYDKIVSVMKRKSDKLEVIRYLLGLHEFGHVSPRRYKLHDFLKIKKDELSPKKVETNHLS